MAINSSNKVPYLLALGAVGGAVGYLFFTDSGKRIVDNISQLRVDKSALIPEKIEDLRNFISDKGRNVTGLVRDAVDRVKGSIDVGQQAFEESGGLYREQLDKLHHSNDEVIANLHKAVDNLGKLMQTAQETFLDPLYEIGAMARGVDRGVRSLVGSFGDKNNIQPISEFREHQRVMG